MAEITLRDYVKSVDQLIEREKLDEAIAHCRYILESYPKHLDTYRLLGKAYLEAKRYGDSADIFQRVLSAVPDDFVAHIGMAIVREDEGNLDAAIWHMERAFETNPANAAIQQELKRLIGRRDGLEPHKVRLTRGALARMYAHGDLYPQAIAELRSALQEDPDRPDLQVLLAEMYWRTDQRAEAAEVCNQVLQKLPYCREANRILAAILHASGKVDEAAGYHRRLAALDPYAAYVENVTVDPATVDASSLRLERLEWQAGRPLPAAPAPVSDWASTLGMGADEAAGLAESAETPEWLASAGGMPESREARPESESTAEAVQPVSRGTPPSEEIPEWISEAGWSPATGEAREGPVSFSDEELRSLESGSPIPPVAPSAAEPAEEELAPAEIPDWLQAKAPSAEDFLREAQAADTSMTDEGPQPAWMSAFEEEARGPSSRPAGVTPAADRTPTEPEGFGEGAFDLQFGAEEEGQPAPAGAGGEDEGPAIPTWLEEVTPGATSTIVTWLGDRAKEGGRPSGGAEVPSWMKRTASEEFGGEEEQPRRGSEAPEAPSWLEEVGEAGDALFGGEATDERAGPGAPPTPAWLFGVAEAAAQGTPSGLDEVSDYLQEGEGEAPAMETFEEAEETRSPAGPAAPDWIRAIAESEPESFEQAFEEAPVDEASTDWLRGLSAEPGGPEPSAGAPEWLEGLAEGTPPADATPVAEMDWLEGLGEPSRPAAAPADVPDWLDGLAAGTGGGLEGEVETAAPVDESLLAEAETPPASAPGQIPGWLDGFGTLEGVEAEGAEAERTEAPGGLDWLEAGEVASADEAAMEAVFPVEAGEVAPGGFPSGPVDDDEVFRWLEDLASKQGDESEGLEPTSIGTGELAAAREPVLRGEVELPEEPGEGLEWLERLAAERGLPEEGAEEAALEERPSREVDQAPGWMLESGVEAEAEPFAEHIEAEAEDEALGWLEEMAQGQPIEPPEPSPVMRRDEELSAPDWLVTMGADEEEPAGAEVPSEVEDEGFGWLEEAAGETGRVTELPSDTFPTADELEWTEFERPEVPQDGGVSDLVLSEIEDEFMAAKPAPTPAAIEEPDEEEVLEWLTRMSAESNQALQESQEEEEAPEWLTQAGFPPAEPSTPEPPPLAAAPPAPPTPTPGAPEWLRIPAEDIPAPQPTTPPLGWPVFGAGEIPAPPMPPPAATPAMPPAAEVPPTPPIAAPIPPVAEVPPVAPPMPPATGVPPAPAPLPPAAGVPSAPPVAPTWPPAAAVPPAPAPLPPAAEVPSAPPVAPPVPPAAAVPPAPAPLPPAAEVPSAPPVAPTWPPAAAIPPAPPPIPPAPAPPPAAPVTPPVPPAAAVPPVPPPIPAAAEFPPAPPVAAPIPPVPEVPLAAPVVPPMPAAAPVPPAPPPMPPVAAAPPAMPPAAEYAPAPPVMPPTPPAPEIPPVQPPAPPAAAAPPTFPAVAPIPPVPPIAPEAAKPRKPDPGQMLDAARVALAAGQTDQAAKAYAALIKRRSQLPTIISDLRAAVELDPRAAGLWQVLGDAFMKNDQVNDAIEAYRRGMEVA